jgi:alpha-1,2-mannosyltransferase
MARAFGGGLIRAGHDDRERPLWCWTLAFMIWLMTMLSPPLLFPVARIAPLLPVLLIVLLLRPGVPAASLAR